MTTTEQPKPKTRTAWQVMWRLKLATVWDKDNWTPLETEVWAKPDWAEARLRHYQKLSLSRVLEFRVEQTQIEVK